MDGRSRLLCLPFLPARYQPVNGNRLLAAAGALRGVSYWHGTYNVHLRVCSRLGRCSHCSPSRRTATSVLFVEYVCLYFNTKITTHEGGVVIGSDASVCLCVLSVLALTFLLKALTQKLYSCCSGTSSECLGQVLILRSRSQEKKTCLCVLLEDGVHAFDY